MVASQPAIEVYPHFVATQHQTIKFLAKLGLILSGFWPAIREQTFVRSAASVKVGSEQTFAAIETNGSNRVVQIIPYAILCESGSDRTLVKSNL